MITGTPHTDGGALQGLRVLIVDDNREDRMLLMDFLSQQGCRVYLAGDGRDGYGKAQTVLPDLILMDITMPVSDGLTACHLLKADSATRHIPLIFLTAAALPHERVQGLAAGAIDYVTKPFNFEEIRLRLGIHLKAYVAPRIGGGARVGAGTEIAVSESDDLNAAAGTLDTVLFRAARKLLLVQLDVTPELASLARAVGTNTHRLNQAFRRCIGMTVFDFLREERMKEAKRLLSETALDIQTIATSLGYGTRRNFSTAFRKHFGVAPSALRQPKE
jgi:DNA-binding response OmpR family regulator